MRKSDVTVAVDNSRANNFNIIRFAAALMVIYGHMFPLLQIPKFLVIGQAISSMGVYIFFLISGYLVSESYMRDTNVLRYTIRRSFRIMPGLSFAVILSAFVLGPLLTTLPIKEYFLNPGTYVYLKNIILYINYSLPGVFESNPYANAVNGSLWSLPIEVLMYVIMPTILFGLKKIKFKNIIIVSITAFILIMNFLLAVVWPDKDIIFYGIMLRQALVLIPFFLTIFLPKFCIGFSTKCHDIIEKPIVSNVDNAK